MNSNDYLWPEPGRKFFLRQDQRIRTSTFDRRTMDEYAALFRASAASLMELACTPTLALNEHALPAVFLFRHYTELALKNLLLLARKLNGEAAEYPSKHGLLLLWDEVAACIDAAGGRQPSDVSEFSIVRGMIGELDQHDRTSVSFRYPEDKNGSRNLPDEFEYFDMPTFRDQAARLAHFFDGLESRLIELNDTRDSLVW